MGFERANGAFSYIEVMNVGREKLVFQLTKIFNDIFLLFTGFIVKDSEIN